VVNVKGPRHRPGALTFSKPFDGFLALMVVQLRLPAEPRASSLGSGPAVIGPLHDALALTRIHSLAGVDAPLMGGVEEVACCCWISEDVAQSEGRERLRDVKSVKNLHGE
jgi:hypothetical protein